MTLMASDLGTSNFLPSLDIFPSTLGWMTVRTVFYSLSRKGENKWLALICTAIFAGSLALTSDFPAGRDHPPDPACRDHGQRAKGTGPGTRPLALNPSFTTYTLHSERQGS